MAKNHFAKNIRKRMKTFGITTDQLSELTFMQKEDIQDIIKGHIKPEQIDEFDLALICSALHCTEEMLMSKTNLLHKPHKSDTKKSIRVKAHIQEFINDMAFLHNILSEN